MAFYQKYRPQKFGDVVGQKHIVRTLKNSVKLDRVTHAYLFSGPRGTGKTSLARILAKALNCQKRGEGDSEPCGNCSACLSIKKGNSLDLLEIDAASNRGIDEIRDLREKVKYAPTELKCKVYIIDEVHMLTKEAFNALLKTLEEPPHHTYFILATTEVYRVPDTVISRCMRFDFGLIGIKDLTDHLKKICEQEKIDFDEEALLQIGRLSMGGMRDALGMLEQVITLAGGVTKDAVEDFFGVATTASLQKLLLHLSRAHGQKAIELINQLYQEGYDLDQFVQNFLDFTRKVLLTQVGAEKRENLTVSFSSSQWEKITPRILIMVGRKFMEVEREMKQAVIPQLPIELAILEICLKQDPELNQFKDNIIEKEEKLEKDFSPQEEKKKKEREKTSSLKEVKKRATKNLAEVKEEDNKEESNPSQKENEESSSKIKENKTEVFSAKNEKKESGEEKKEQDVELGKEITLEEVISHWKDVLVEIKKYNHSLESLMKACEPCELCEGHLKLAFPYKFHKEKLSEKANRRILEDVLKKTFHKLLLCRFEVRQKVNPPLRKGKLKTKKPADVSAKGEVADQLKEMQSFLGGEIIEEKIS